MVAKGRRKEGGAQPAARKRHAREDDEAESGDGELVADSGGGGGDDDDAIAAELVDEPEISAIGLRPRPTDRSERATPLARYDPLQAYMRDVQRHRLLTPEEEKEAALKYY